MVKYKDLKTKMSVEKEPKKSQEGVNNAPESRDKQADTVAAGLTKAARDEQAKTVAEGLTELNFKAGEVQKSQLKLVQENKAHREADRKKLRGSKIEDIRFSSNTLTGKTSEKPAEKFQNIKAETARRILAYSSNLDQAVTDQWITLDYESMGADSAGRTHEQYIGLGDILLDPDIKEIAVKKNGEIIRAKRGITSAGRQAFLTEDGEYVATFTGDQYMILSNKVTDVSNEKELTSYLNFFNEEEKARSTATIISKDEEANSYSHEENHEASISNNVYLNDRESVVSQLKITLTPSHLAMANIVEEEFKAAGLSNGIIAAALVNVRHESNFNPNAVGDGGNSVGLFQLNIHGAGHGMTVEERKDPRKNCRRIIEIIKGRSGKALLAAAASKRTVPELAAIFSRDIERPAKVEHNMRERAKTAAKFFGERLQENTGETVKESSKIEGLPSLINVKSNQDRWILGSSGALHVNDYLQGNSGVCGIGGAGSGNFLRMFKENIWPKIDHLKLPKEIILVGLAVNTIGGKTNEEILNDYEKIATFFESKGVRVKFATVQVARPKHLSTAEKKENFARRLVSFNDDLRKKFPTQYLEVSKYTSSSDGSEINSSLAASDGIHFNKKGKELYAAILEGRYQG